MKPPNSSLVKVIREGLEESQQVAIRGGMPTGGTVREFANRMSCRLKWAAERIEELEAQAHQASWEGQVDRQGGAFDDAEILQRVRDVM